MRNDKVTPDFELIRKAIADDGDALYELMNRYQPIVNNVQGRFYIRHFDTDDWNQEALITGYKTCLNFDLNKNSSFGAFFKVNFVNRAKNLLRHEMAQQRAPYNSAVSYELVKANGLINDQSVELSVEPLREKYRNLLLDLSNIELAAMFVYLGILDQDKAIERFGVSHEQITRAKSRLKRKMKEMI